MACRQDQIKKFPWTVDRAAALFAEARTNYIEKGITDFNKIVDGLSASHNLKREIIIKGLSEPKGVPRNVTDDMWVKQQQARQLASNAKAAVLDMDKSKFMKGLNFVAEAPRRTVLAGHFGAFTKSHLSDQLFYNPEAYAKNFKDSWALAVKSGRAAHEQRLMSTLNPTDPDIKLGLRSGLNIGEGGAGRFRTETKEMTGIKKIFGGPDRASMAYDELRMRRAEIWKKELARLSPEERGDIEQTRALASVINHDTGTTKSANRVMRFLFLSPRLLPAQLSHTLVDIPKALFDVGRGFSYAKAAPASRYVARKTAILASAYTATLAANYGISKAIEASGNKELAKKFMPNFGQEGVGRTSFLRPKIAGFSVPISPTIELMKAPVQMIAAGAAAKKGDNKAVAALMRGLQTVLGRQNPIWTAIEEGIFGQNIGTGRPTPFPGLTGTTKPTPSRPKMTVAEYAGTKLPIPASNFVREFYDEATSHGMPPKDALGWVRLLGVPAAEGITSYHLSPVREPKKKTY